jgi:putative peptidoglycan lipid II flippase
MISRVLGFVRDTILARILVLAWPPTPSSSPSSCPTCCGVSSPRAFSQAFVPILAEYKTQQGEEATRTFIAYVSGLLTLVLALVTASACLPRPGWSGPRRRVCRQRRKIRADHRCCG